MAGTALRGGLSSGPRLWQTATVTAITRETGSVVTIGLDAPHWQGQRAGQHVDVRLTAEDGYTAEREYSIASAPGEPVAITVERLEDGEVSPYLTEELRAGDELELRGPVGGYFVWEPADGGPLMLLAGGSGIVPLRSIVRHRRRAGSNVPVRLLYSARTWEDVIYRDELGGYHDGVEVSYTLTRRQPPRMGRLHGPDRPGPARRGRLARRGRRAGLHLRADELRRGRRGRPGRHWLPARAGEDRAVRRDRRALMDPVDGNAIASLLIDVFGTEMTAARSTCASCGSSGPVAELVVYLQAPGTVVRCRNCGSVLIVLLRHEDKIGVDLSGLASLSQPGLA